MSEKLTIVPTFEAKIYLGTLPGYVDTSMDFCANYETLMQKCQDYCDECKLGLSIKTIDFVYVNGREGGFEIGLINYPRFPSSPYKITEHAIKLAKILKKTFKQERVTIVTSNETIMIGDL